MTPSEVASAEYHWVVRLVWHEAIGDDQHVQGVSESGVRVTHQLEHHQLIAMSEA
jgi:hypothetical protein